MQRAIKIVDLLAADWQSVEQTATVLLAAFAGDPTGWPDLAAGLEEVRESLGPERISRIALDEGDKVLGWIAGRSDYDGNVWELHPLAVHPNVQGQGIGSLLVADFEQQVRQRGGLTVWLGTDDLSSSTSVGAVDLYPDVLGHAARIHNLDRHPFAFYQKCGYVVAGLLPDANGFGKPDIFMAKRVGGLGVDGDVV